MSGNSANEPAVDFHFGPYRLDGRLRRLYKDGEPVVLTPKAMDTLVALMERSGRVVEKAELVSVVWGDVFVGDDTLAQNISTLRKMFGDDPNAPQFIATIPRRGYKFIAQVQTGPPEPAVEVRERPAGLMPRRFPWRLAAVVGGLALVAAGVLSGRSLLGLLASDPPPAPVEFTIAEPEAQKFSAAGGMLALSPDGQHVTFVTRDSAGVSSIWLRPLTSSTARPLNGTEGVIQMFWSPDSRAIGFFADQRLKAVDVSSGTVRVIATLSSGRALGGTWSRTDQILFSVPQEGLYLVPAAGGAPERLLPLDAACADCAIWPHFLPDGRRFLYTVASGEMSARGVYVGELGRPRGRRLLEAVSSATFIPPGFLSYASSGTLYVQRVDPESLELTGGPVPLADGVALNARTGRAVAATSEAGVVAFRRPLVTELVWVDRAGNSIGAATPPGTYLDFSVAPDGQHVAVSRLDARSGTSDIWVFGPGRVARVTDDAAWDGDPVWSEDGQHVAYSSRRDGRWRIYRRPATAVGPEELLLDAATPVAPLQVLGSGHLVYYSRQSTADIWKLSAEGPTPLAHMAGVAGGLHTIDARLSSDGQWLASGWQRIVVSGVPFGSSSGAVAEDASMPRWRSDGRELFYLSQEFTIVSIPVDPPRTPGESPGRTLFRASELTPTGINGQVYDAAPDGQRFLLKREVRSSPIHVVLNWDARLTPP